MDLTIKDAGAAATTGASTGGCGCGCGCGDAATTDAPAASTAGATVADYTVTGMTCGHCVSAVTEEVSAIPGVTDVAVDLASGHLTVTSAAPIDVDRIVEALDEAGDYSLA